MDHLEFEEAAVRRFTFHVSLCFSFSPVFFSTSEPSTLKRSETEIMLGRCDSVHSGVAMAFVAVGIVGLTVVSTLGLMGYFGVPNGTWDEGKGDFWGFFGIPGSFCFKVEAKTCSKWWKRIGFCGGRTQNSKLKLCDLRD